VIMHGFDTKTSFRGKNSWSLSYELQLRKEI
jgi:hypothetical protein